MPNLHPFFDLVFDIEGVGVFFLFRFQGRRDGEIGHPSSGHIDDGHALVAAAVEMLGVQGVGEGFVEALFVGVDIEDDGGFAFEGIAVEGLAVGAAPLFAREGQLRQGLPHLHRQQRGGGKQQKKKLFHHLNPPALRPGPPRRRW